MKKLKNKRLNTKSYLAFRKKKKKPKNKWQLTVLYTMESCGGETFCLLKQIDEVI